MPAVVLLRDQFEIHGALSAVTALHLEAHVWEDEAIVLDMEALRLTLGQPCVAIEVAL